MPHDDRGEHENFAIAGLIYSLVPRAAAVTENEIDQRQNNDPEKDSQNIIDVDNDLIDAMALS